MFLFLYADFEEIIISAILNQKCRHSKRNLQTALSEQNFIQTLITVIRD